MITHFLILMIPYISHIKSHRINSTFPPQSMMLLQGSVTLWSKSSHCQAPLSPSGKWKILNFDHEHPFQRQSLSNLLQILQLIIDEHCKQDTVTSSKSKSQTKQRFGIHPPVSLLTSMESVLPPTLHMHIIQEAHLTFRFGGSSYLCFSITPAEQFQKKYRNAVSISQ